MSFALAIAVALARNTCTCLSLGEHEGVHQDPSLLWTVLQHVLISQRLPSGLFLNSSIDMQAPELKLQGDWGRWGLGTV